jgi:hypothetical protein
MPVTAQRVSQILREQGIANKPEAAIESDLNRLQNANWLERSVIASRTGMNGDEAKRTGANAQRLTNDSFGGSEHRAIAFLKGLEGSEVGKLDFNELCESGAAGRLAKLTPDQLEKVKAGHYQNAAELNQALDTDPSLKRGPQAQVAAKGPAHNKPGDTKPADANGTPNKPADVAAAAPGAAPSTSAPAGEQMDAQQMIAQLKELFEKLFSGTALAGLMNSAASMLGELGSKHGISGHHNANITNYNAEGQKIEPPVQTYSGESRDFRNNTAPGYGSPTTNFSGPTGMG